ncbi:hypothetical protein [Paraburkholderia sp. MM5482-R1]|uniref:hypothetical protein n=1 Tax=unclassified Paraburkholderia TaxID=2615204 RepID=UPI003D1B65A4
MLKRRQFLGSLTALGGSVILSACGGGGTEDSGIASSAAAQKASATAKSASPNGSAMPPASSLIDGAGATWTLSGGSVYQNGAKAGNNYNVIVALCYNGNIYVENTSGQFSTWTGSGWQGCSDPRLGTTSPDGTTMPSAASIIDKTGAVWTLTNGVIYKNGVVVGINYNVTLVLWYGGKVYCCNTSGQFYANAEVASQWLPCTDPRIAVAAAAGSFYGINGHFDYTYTPAQVVSILKGLGCTSYRVGCTSDPSELNAVVKLAQAFQSAGMTLLVTIAQGFYDTSGTLFASESASYNAGYASASTIANALKPYGVALYECGNELTRDKAIIIDSTNAGTKAIDFNNANWPLMRGAMRGMIDGVKSVLPSAKCGINFCVADVGASDALWDGIQPDGSGGHPKVRWDITTWHNYEVYGDIFNIGTDGAGPGIDLPTYCKARYGVPFIITEWNTGPEQTQAYRANYITSQFGSFYAARKTHNIQSVMYYVLDSGNNTFGIMTNGVPLNPPYGAFTGFTSSHADI